MKGGREERTKKRETDLQEGGNKGSAGHQRHAPGLGVDLSAGPLRSSADRGRGLVGVIGLGRVQRPEQVTRLGRLAERRHPGAAVDLVDHLLGDGLELLLARDHLGVVVSHHGGHLLVEAGQRTVGRGNGADHVRRVVGRGDRVAGQLGQREVLGVRGHRLANGGLGGGRLGLLGVSGRRLLGVRAASSRGRLGLGAGSGSRRLLGLGAGRGASGGGLLGVSAASGGGRTSGSRRLLGPGASGRGGASGRAGLLLVRAASRRRGRLGGRRGRRSGGRRRDGGGGAGGRGRRR
ncbi:hypothetical protein BC828DRAFT_372666 [Blastocladiella britannica]|nr:hypothetical protein BC828DRAFT_372666 [Blastocladiella britannica]